MTTPLLNSSSGLLLSAVLLLLLSLIRVPHFSWNSRASLVVIPLLLTAVTVPAPFPPPPPFPERLLLLHSPRPPTPFWFTPRDPLLLPVPPLDESELPPEPPAPPKPESSPPSSSERYSDTMALLNTSNNWCSVRTGGKKRTQNKIGQTFRNIVLRMNLSRNLSKKSSRLLNTCQSHVITS